MFYCVFLLYYILFKTNNLMKYCLLIPNLLMPETITMFKLIQAIWQI